MAYLPQFQRLHSAGKGLFEIFINTNELTTIHPFGKDVFQKNLRGSNKLLKNLVFIGKNGREIGIS